MGRQISQYFFQEIAGNSAPAPLRSNTEIAQQIAIVSLRQESRSGNHIAIEGNAVNPVIAPAFHFVFAIGIEAIDQWQAKFIDQNNRAGL